MHNPFELREPGPRSAAVTVRGVLRGALCAGMLLALAGCRAGRPPGADFARDPVPQGWRLRHQALEAIGTWQPAAATYELRAGTLDSREFPVTPGQWFRVEVRYRAPARAWCGVFFADHAGRQLRADHWDCLDAAPAGTTHVFCFRAHADAATAWLRLAPPEREQPLAVQRVRVTPVPPADVVRWAATVTAGLPPPAVDLSADRLRWLPRTRRALAEGGPLRIVCLGDSIVNDLSTGPLELLLAQHHPGLDGTVVTSVRGGTGCGYYAQENRVEEYVLRHRPDLLIIGGISTNFDAEAVRSVVRQVRARQSPDILLMTGAVAPPDLPDYSRRRTPEQLREQRLAYDAALATVAAEEGCAFLHLQRVWDDYVAASGQAPEFFRRDWLHASSRGRVALAEILARFLQVADVPGPDLAPAGTDADR